MTLEEKLDAALVKQGQEAEKQGLPAPKRLLRNAQQRGALSSLKEQLRRKQCSDTFDALADRGALQFAPEALVVSREFGSLFTDEEADFCLQQLLEAGYYGIR